MIPDKVENTSKGNIFQRLLLEQTRVTSNDDYYNDGTTLWVKPDDLDQFNPICDTKQKLTHQGVSQSRLVTKGSVLVCGIGTIGKFGYSLQDVCTIQQINSIEFDKKFSSRFGLFSNFCS